MAFIFIIICVHFSIIVLKSVFCFLLRFPLVTVLQHPTMMQNYSAFDFGSSRQIHAKRRRESLGVRLLRSRVRSASRRKLLKRNATTPACAEIAGAGNTDIDKQGLPWPHRHYHHTGETNLHLHSQDLEGHPSENRVQIVVNLFHSEWTRPNPINRHQPPAMKTLSGDTMWRNFRFPWATFSRSTSADRSF